MTGKFKIWSGRWRVFLYRNTNGITEVREQGNSFYKWTVGSIPEGAIIIK